MITLANVLTPIRPGREDELAASLAALPTGPSPLATSDTVHFARWVIIGSPHGHFAGLSARRRQLRMKYLLMTAAVDGGFEAFVEVLRTTAGPLADQVWASSVGYPDRTDRPAFHAYFAHNRLAVPHSYIAHQETVPEIRRALAVRAKHLELARSLQADARLEPLDAFAQVGFG